MEAVCPLLALAADGRSVAEGADPAHRCHADQPPSTIDRAYQARVCLTSAYPQCERFLARIDGPGNREPARASIADGVVSTRLTLVPEPAWHGFAGRARVGRRGGLALLAAATVVAVGAASALASGFGLLSDETPPAAGASPSAPSATTSPTATERPTSTPIATPTATPAPTATVAPTPIPTVAATPAPTAEPVRTYVVEQGDTLAAIAQRFGVTLQALQAANDLEDPDEINIGQVLVIP